MADSTDWALAYARQAAADFHTYETLQQLDLPQCHRLQFLQMACEKLVKAHLCAGGADPATLQQSHGYVARTLPIVIRQHMALLNFTGRPAREILRRAKHLSQEIEVLAPAVKRGGGRPDNCEYPWEDRHGKLHLPLNWSFYPAQLLLLPSGPTFLKMVRGAIERLVSPA